MGLIAVNRVLRECALTPGIDTADTVNIQVDIQIDKAPALDLVRMARAFL